MQPRRIHLRRIYSSWIRYSSLALLVMVLCVMAGCSDGQPPAPSEQALTEAPQDATPHPTEAPSEPLMVLEELYGVPCPTIAGTDQAEGINRQLEGYYRPIASTISRWYAASGYSFVHTIRQEEDSYLIESLLSLSPYGSIQVGSVRIRADGQVSFPSEPNLTALADGNFMRNLETLLRLGVSIPLDGYGQAATSGEMYQIFAACYESLAHQRIDTTRIVPEVENDWVRKVLALELLDYYPGVDFPTDATLYLQDLQSVLARWIVAVERDIYQQYSRIATAEDALDLIELFLQSCAAQKGSSMPGLYVPDDDSPAATPDALAQHLRSVIPADYGQNLDTELTRLDLAKILVSVYEDIFGEIRWDESNASPAPYDTQDPAALKAAASMIMTNYPSYVTFEPELEVQLYTLPGLMRQFASQTYLSGFYESGYLEIPALTTEHLVKVAVDALKYYKDRTPSSLPMQQVSLDRDWDWYMNQYETGAYNYINCMPTLAAMAMKWLDQDSEITPQALREHIPENTGGWYMYNVEQVFDDYGVKYTSKSVSLENILADIDAGNLAFCQINEGDVNQSGHCFIVYGYRRQGENLWLLTQDPASAFTNQYGEPVGKHRVVDAQYGVWIISRFSTRYLSIPPATNPLYVP